MRARLAENAKREVVEIQFSLADPWSRTLFLALCRRYALQPYRLARQRRTTVMLRAPKAFVDEVLWPEFQELDGLLRGYLGEVTLRIVREQVHKDTSEAPEVQPPPGLPGR